MSDEDTQDQQVQDPQVDWEARFKELEAQTQEAQSEIKRLVGENKKYRERAQNAEFAGLKAKFPQLEPDDIAGLNAEQVEKLLSKVTAPPSQEDEQTSQPSPEATQAQAFASSAGGQAPLPSEPISFEEAKRRGGPGNPEVRALIAKGLVEGVDAPA